MKTLPILFSTPMVQAILAGNKSQTRREIKPTSVKGCYGITIAKDKDGNVTDVTGMDEDGRNHDPETGNQYSVNGRWKVGDVLWVRELHYRYGYWNMNGVTKTGKQKWIFIADKRFNEIRYFDNPPAKVEKNTFRGTGWYKRNSLFMPREACRLFLKVTDVRVERLQDISEEDCIAEGIQKHEGGYKTNFRQPNTKSYLDGYSWTAKESYQILWESINGKGSWELNPFVWVIKFERITKPE